jgi:hypothetical protein
MLKYFISNILFLTVVAADAQVIKTLGDYRLYNELHIVRTDLIGEDVLLHNPEDYPDVTLLLYRTFIPRHDRAKRNKNLLRQLFELYNQPINTPQMLALRNSLAAKLNAIDAIYAYEFFEKNHLIYENGALKPAAVQLLRIEMIADFVDRYKNPLAGEEFGREQYPNSVHPLLTDHERVIATAAESRYFDVVKGYLYSDYSNCEAKLVARGYRRRANAR